MDQITSQYIAALKELVKKRSKKVQNGLLMLKANYRAEQRKITASSLAKAAGYDSYSTGNEQYGSFAHDVYELGGFDFDIEKRKDGSPIWTTTICNASSETDKHGHFQWSLKPKVACALEQLNLVKPIPVDDILKEIKDKRPELSNEPKKFREAIIQARIGQGLFRERLVNHWEGCSVTGFKNTEFLIASHIKPWRDCSPSEAIDMTNGLLLLPNIDRAFDRGYISFDTSQKITLSPQLKEADIKGLGLSKDMALRWCYSHHETFLEHHRKFVFRSDE